MIWCENQEVKGNHDKVYDVMRVFEKEQSPREAAVGEVNFG